MESRPKINLFPWRDQRKQYAQKRMLYQALFSIVFAIALIFCLTQLCLVHSTGLMQEKRKAILLRERLNRLNKHFLQLNQTIQAQVKQRKKWKEWLFDPYLTWFKKLPTIISGGYIKAMQCRNWQCHFNVMMKQFSEIQILLKRIQSIFLQAKLTLGQIQQRTGQLALMVNVSFLGKVKQLDVNNQHLSER